MEARRGRGRRGARSDRPRQLLGCRCRRAPATERGTSPGCGRSSPADWRSVRRTPARGVRWRVGSTTVAHTLVVVDGTPASYALATGLDGPATMLTFHAAGDEVVSTPRPDCPTSRRRGRPPPWAWSSTTTPTGARSARRSPRATASAHRRDSRSQHRFPRA